VLSDRYFSSVCFRKPDQPQTGTVELRPDSSGAAVSSLDGNETRAPHAARAVITGRNSSSARTRYRIATLPGAAPLQSSHT
jgi:hypothetical protein